MDVQSYSSDGLFEGLPAVIGLPGCLPVRPGYRRTPLAEVCVPEELPPYLLLGRLDRGSFESTDAGWSARWIGATPDTYVEAQYEREKRWLEVRQVWRRVEGGRSFVPTEDFGRAVQLLYMPLPALWDQEMAQRLEDVYRLKYCPAQQDQYGFTGIPDGGFKTIGVPVPIARLADLYDCFARLARDPELGVPVSGRLELRFGTINYVTGRGPTWAEDPERLFLASYEATGLLPLGLPALEHAKDGTSAWTVRRLVYLATINVPFAGLEFVLERLAERGFIRRQIGAHGVEPGVESDAFVGPSALELQAQSVAWMDQEATRRVFYLLNSEEELARGGVERMAAASGQSEEDARELIRQAVIVSVRQRRWLAGVALIDGVVELLPE